MPEPFALANVSIVTGDAHGTVLSAQSVVIGASGDIERVGPTADTPAPPGYRLMDMPGHHLVPGLINAHAHLFSNGLPLPPFLVKESTAALVTKLGRSPVGRRLFKKRAKTNALI